VFAGGDLKTNGVSAYQYLIGLLSALLQAKQSIDRLPILLMDFLCTLP
jgi:hypothetical protein